MIDEKYIEEQEILTNLKHKIKSEIEDMINDEKLVISGHVIDLDNLSSDLKSICEKLDTITKGLTSESMIEALSNQKNEVIKDRDIARAAYMSCKVYPW
ncbi:MULTISPECIES: hypothetical protein [Staphylococcus]|uniref:hypothetical protein n=1 Tax=Staphylococcus TaxID=1279 RepID=UPI0021CEC12E|nr:hypothetical protein [Staphylococcus sp. IVB6181]UXV34888.1 hypothetical protein MUA90_13025 [Staphylococcus sp. IVB6181]